MLDLAGPHLTKGTAGTGGAPFVPSLVVYQESEEPRHHWLDPVEAALRNLLQAAARPVLSQRLRAVLEQVLRLEAEIAALDAQALGQRTAETRRRLRRQGIAGPAVAEAFALIREQARRSLGLFPHPVQVLGGLAMLRGAVAEMETGEGKTLTATLAAGAAAMAGLPVHVITVNDYLASRDAETMAPLFDALGLSVGVLVHGAPPQARRAVYRHDIVYASNKEIAFDYLRDRLALGGPPSNARLKIRRMIDAGAGGPTLLLRGLHFAIVDEADSVLVDEARTPLILSRESDAAAERAWAEVAHRLADQLLEGRDYRLHREESRVSLSKSGCKLLERLGLSEGGLWVNRIRREHAVRQALAARLIYRNGEHYILQDGKVAIVDEYTGRVMADRSWNDGMHQLVEVKEGVEVTPRKDVLARLTYQRFFRRYRHLAGMTGTAREVAGELSAVYGLTVVPIPTNVRSRRLRLPERIFPTEAAKWQAVIDRTRNLCAAGRPVLIGTRTVAAADRASAALTEAGIAHRVLSARQDAEEAEIIAEAGQPGTVTVATNMAGRGVDIHIPPEVVARGGLHVILTERHDSRRVDRQLEGRTARRGEPGSSEAMLSLADRILDGVQQPGLRGLARLPGPVGELAARHLFRAAQRAAERSHARARRILLDQDRRLGKMLAFSGKPE